MTTVLEVGGRAIYEMRPRKVRWDLAAAETRSAYRARMQELMNELATSGYVIKPAVGPAPHRLNPSLTPGEARALKGAGRR